MTSPTTIPTTRIAVETAPEIPDAPHSVQAKPTTPEIMAPVKASRSGKSGLDASHDLDTIDLLSDRRRPYVSIRFGAS